MRRDDPSDFDAIFAEYGARIYRFCRRSSGSADDAEDLTQEIFIRAFQGRDRFQGRSTFATWLYRIALLHCRKRAARVRPETVPFEEERGDARHRDPASVILDRIDLEAAIAGLPGPLREAFLLVKAGGLKYREAAEVLGIPQGTVQSRVHDASRRLRAALSEEAFSGNDALEAPIEVPDGKKAGDDV